MCKSKGKKPSKVKINYEIEVMKPPVIYFIGTGAHNARAALWTGTFAVINL